MILAAADYANGVGEPPPALRLALSCERWNCLPEAGGLLDQPAGLMQRMAIAYSTFNAFREIRKSENDVEWSKENPELWNIIVKTRELRKDINDGR